MTAYDLRISDWSSDVCSSDLRRPELGEPAVDFSLALLHLVVDAEAFAQIFLLRDLEAHDELVALRLAVQGETGGVGPAMLQRLQIGRASCRDRVCQYV